MFWSKQRSASSPSRLYCSSLFCECPKFCDLAKQRRKIFQGVSEVGKDDFSLYFCWRCVVFLVLYYNSSHHLQPKFVYPLTPQTKIRPVFAELKRMTKVLVIYSHFQRVTFLHFFASISAHFCSRSEIYEVQTI